MMAGHRSFIRDVKRLSSIRGLVTSSGSAELKSAYNSVADSMNEFRRQRFQLVHDHVTKPSHQAITRGTGGSVYAEILRDAGAATNEAPLPVKETS